MNCSALVLVFLCLVCTHLCDRLKRKKTFVERLTPPKPQVGKRLVQAFPKLFPSELNGVGLRKLSQEAVKKEAETKANVRLAASLGRLMFVGGVSASLGSDDARAVQNSSDTEGGLHGALALSQKSSGPSGAETSHQTFPPITIGSRDSRQLLQNWGDSTRAPGMRQTPNAEVCDRLRDLVAMVDRSPNDFPRLMKGLEMVGMISKASLQSGSSAVALESLNALDVSVKAVGVFKRGTVEDDCRGSLRQQIEEHYENGKQLTRDWRGSPKKQLDVFVLEGLADSPDFSESSARVLMSQIARYAEEEQKVVVVLKRTYKKMGEGGPEVLSHYERLGFKKVELQEMEQNKVDALGHNKAINKVDAQGQVWRRPGPHVLLYLGDAPAIDKVGNEAIRAKQIAQDESVENQQMMIGIKLWTGL